VTGIYLPVVARDRVRDAAAAGRPELAVPGRHPECLHAGYFLFLQLGYRLGDLSVGYPIGRVPARCSPRWLDPAARRAPSLISGAGILAIGAGVL